uniref:HID1 domain containing n=2 Tax=Sus scrofa TaxID=9823 RepID=A0A8D1D3H1_PIG
MWVDRSVKGEPKERMLREKNKVGRTGITRKKLEKAGFESVGPVMAWGPMVRSGGGGREVGKDAGPGGWVVMGEAGGGKRGGITHRHRRKGLEALDPDKKDAGRATTVDGSGRPRAPGVGGAGRGRCGGRSPIGRGQEGAGSTPGRRAGCAAPLLREQLGPRSGAGYRVRSPGGSQGWGRAGAGSNDMGSADSKLNFRKAVIQLTTKTQPVEATDDAFWDQFWADTATSVQDVFALVPAAEIRAVREESPSNLATLCYKAVEKLVQGAESGCHSEKEKQIVLNCSRLLTRVLPCIFEDPDWRGFFWSTVPGAGRGGGEDDDENARPLAESLLLAIADLLFCPDFTVQSHRRSTVDSAEDIHSLDSCEYIWEAGVGFAHSPQPSYIHDMNRMELLKLLLTCFSEAMYLPPAADCGNTNPWVQFFCSTENRHALPLFTSLLNTVCAYDPVGYGIPYNHLLFSDYREPLVEEAAQVLIVTLDHDSTTSASPTVDGTTTGTAMDDADDFQFILKGIARLLSNPLLQTYLPNSTKKIQFHQELLVLFWKLCDFNKKFLFFVLKSSDVLDILVPILYFLNDARADQSRVGLMHIGVFILLLLSGERNFGVRLNKPYSVRVPMDIPVFTGTHADLLIVVFHKIITSGHQRLQPLFDCLLTIVVNVSPYLKSLSMVAANKLLHLLEAFSTTWFLFSAAQNHHLVFFLLEVFNNIIQYQFDGNSNLVYAIIRKRSVFHQLANLPTDPPAIHKALQRRRRAPEPLSRTGSQEGASMEGSRPAVPAEPGTLKTSLVATPGLALGRGVDGGSRVLAEVLGGSGRVAWSRAPGPRGVGGIRRSISQVGGRCRLVGARLVQRLSRWGAAVAGFSPPPPTPRHRQANGEVPGVRGWHLAIPGASAPAELGRGQPSHGGGHPGLLESASLGIPFLPVL